MESFDHKKIDRTWQEHWKNQGTYDTNEQKEQTTYVLDMFPYPSGEGLHVGHPKGYIATDIYSRYHRMCGEGVLHPMGWDAFGLPAENFAIKTGTHPKEAVAKNIARFKEQLANIGLDYDWNREINTTDPEYYRWTQWIFLQLYKQGLAYQSHEPINWCPSCQTGLANEDLEQGACERCGSEVEKKPMRQWVLKITEYADRLLEDLENLDWPESIKESQRNWIGRSEGAVLPFGLSNDTTLEVFTTRADTLWGVTYLVVAPEHPLMPKLLGEVANHDDVHAYIEQAKQADEITRTDVTREKTGVLLEGVTAAHPLTNESLPVYVADYVLAHYGTGAIMAVPAHDERDAAFAETFDLPVKEVITQEGVVKNSGDADGMDSETAKSYLTKAAEGKQVTIYRLRDWVFSRQRYWGEPIPIVHDADGAAYPVDESELPVTLPDVAKYEPTGTGESPLAGITDWVEVSGYITEEGTFKQGGDTPQTFYRETNTMPQWAGSSWYYLRYIDPHNEQALVDSQKEAHWMPVSMYVGGAEHATRHLIYARFWHKFLFDIKAVSTPEPFTRLQHVGLVLAEDGRKMSKRFGNVINPDDVIAEFGADAFRMYEMFMGPFAQKIAWSTENITGVRRFLDRVWSLKDKVGEGELSDEKKRVLHKTIAKVGHDIERFSFNTAISQLMILVKELQNQPTVPKEVYGILCRLLAPFAPHITEELWKQLGEPGSIHHAQWPKADEQYLVDEEVTIAVQVDGKVRASIHIPTDASEEEVTRLAYSDPAVQRHMAGKEVKKVIFIPGKIINILTT
mgnify:CR=1 FL=1